MKKNISILSSLLSLLITSCFSGLTYASETKPNLNISLQKAIVSGGGAYQLGCDYVVEPKWSVGIHGVSGAPKGESIYGVDTVRAYGAGLNAAYYRYAYDLESFLTKGSITLHSLDLKQKGFKVDGNDRLGMKQLDVDILGGYQFVWNREFVLAITAGLRKSFLDVPRKGYVFLNSDYDTRVFHAMDVEAIHLLVELGFGVLI